MKYSTIEANLDAITVTPKLHRLELESYVHPPQIDTVVYIAEDETAYATAGPLCSALYEAAVTYSMRNDPYVLHLSAQGDARAQRSLEKVFLKQNSYCCLQIRAFDRRAQTIFGQLGLGAAERYIATYVGVFKEGMSEVRMIQDDLATQEQNHIWSLLVPLHTLAFRRMAPENADVIISDKVEKLLQILTYQAAKDVRGIIFVEQRATVSALVTLLRNTPQLRSLYDVAGFVGTSTSDSRQEALVDLVELQSQTQDLEDFRTGKKNLIVATDVLQEGIDVSACNLVICFDLPKILVAFVQRRGRARQKGSTYALFIANDEVKANPAKWQALENKMRAAYMDEQRQPADVEMGGDDADAGKFYRVESTGALLTLDNAKSHLYHFCAKSTLQASSYIDTRPEFITEKVMTPVKGFKASVSLPTFVHADLRTAESSKVWACANAEDTAIKDAAFGAYVTLHKAGLLNDNLLPLVKDNGPEAGQTHMDQPSIVQVSERLNPWVDAARSVHDGTAQWQASTAILGLGGKETVRMHMWTPATLEGSLKFDLYWNEDTTYAVEITATTEPYLPLMSQAYMQTIESITSLILSSVHGTRLSVDRADFAVLFCPPTGGHSLDWLGGVQGFSPASSFLDNGIDRDYVGLIRVAGQTNKAYLLSHTQPAGSTTATNVAVTAFPKRKDFLHPVVSQLGMGTAYAAEQVFPFTDCTIDNLPASNAIFAAFVPSIIHRIELQLIAQDLHSSVLKSVGVIPTSLLLEALSSPSANEPTDYNRLEYLGDAILKFCTHLQVMAQHPTWPEGYLTSAKGRIIGNKNLAQACLTLGLDKYILTQSFTGNKWQPYYLSDLLSTPPTPAKRTLSTKTLADVVESLIGAAFVSGGLPQAHLCLQTLLPHGTWSALPALLCTLTSNLPTLPHAPPALLETLVGHTFAHATLLLEAITHASCPNSATGLSYERLEFLGDAVLDLIVVPKLHAHAKRKLRHWELHQLHEALVNGYFLGYCCMRFSVFEDTFKVDATNLAVREVGRRVHLHDFVRASVQLVLAKAESVAAFAQYGGKIEVALREGREYPWPDLLAMSPMKFLSDLVEAVLGALYLDTGGNLSACERFVERLGILDVMRRLLDEEVVTMSPKERLGVAAGNEKVEYTNSQTVNEDAKKTVFACVVRVGGREVASMSGCRNKAEAEARAALKAVEALGSASRKRKADDDDLIVKEEVTLGADEDAVMT